MAKRRVVPAVAALGLILVFSLVNARAAVPDYKLGDVAAEDVVTPVPLVVVNPEATEALRQRVAQQVTFIVRFNADLATEAETELRQSVAAARQSFLTNVQPADFETPGFARLIREVAKNAPKDMPFDKLVPLWVRGSGDDALIQTMVQPLRAVMAQPIMGNKTDAALPANQPVRILPVKSLSAAPTAQEMEGAGTIVNSGKVLSLWRAKRLVETHFPSGQEGLGVFASSFVRANAIPDQALTDILRTRRVEGVTVNETYDAAQAIVRKGQVIDRKALGALAAMREKSLIGTLQTKLEQQQSVAGQLTQQTKWIAASVAIGCVGFIVILWRLRSRPAATLMTVPPQPSLPGPDTPALAEGEGEAAWRERALLAEQKAHRAQEAIRSGALGWMREHVFRSTVRQRAELLSAQQKAEAEMRELEERLEQLHTPLRERISAYEQRIEELERELNSIGEENRELLGARINVTKQVVERERSRVGTN